MQRHLSEAVQLMASNGILSSHASPEEMYHNLATIHFIETGGRLNPESWTGVRGSMQVTNATFNDTYNKYAGILEAAGVPRNREDPRASAIVGSLYYNDGHADLDGNATAAAVAYNSGPQAGQNYLSGNTSAIRSEGRNYAVKFDRNLPAMKEALAWLGSGPSAGVPYEEIFAQSGAYYNHLETLVAESRNFPADKRSNVVDKGISELQTSLHALKGDDAFKAQLAALQMAQQLGITVSEEEQIQKEMGLIDDTERARIEALPKAEKEKLFESGTIIAQNDKWYDLGKSEIAKGSASERLMTRNAEAYTSLDDPQRAAMRETHETKLAEAQEAERKRRDELVNAGAAAAASGMSEEMILLGLLGAALAFASGNEAAGNQILGMMFGQAASNGFAENLGYSRGYGATDADRDFEPADSSMPDDVLAKGDFGKLGFTKDPTKPYWVALNAEGKPVAGNMAFERATPMSTTKMATLLTISDMMAKGELPKDFLDKNSSLVDSMMQRSSNSAPVELARLASGSHDAFVSRMNQMAQERGLQGTHYGSPVGLNPADDSKIAARTYSTAYDVALVGYHLNKDHYEISKRYADIGQNHTGRAFDGVNGTTMGKTGTGYGGEGRDGANKAFVGIIGQNGATYAVLESVKGHEQTTYIQNASRIARDSATLAALDVSKERDGIRAQETVRVPSDFNMVGKKLDIDPSLLNANAQGKALVAVQVGEYRRGAPGELMLVDVKTGIVEDSFSFISGGGGPSSEMQTNGPSPGLSGKIDFEPNQEDINARWGLGALVNQGKSWWKDGKGREWHVKTEDPVAHRNAMWIHPVRTNQSVTHGCLGIRPEDSARFYETYAKSGFDEVTFISRNVLQRSYAKQQEQSPQEPVIRKTDAGGVMPSATPRQFAALDDVVNAARNSSISGGVEPDGGEPKPGLPQEVMTAALEYAKKNGEQAKAMA